VKARIALVAVIPECPKHGRYSAKFWDATIDSSPSDRFHAGGEGLICQEIEVVIDIRDYSTK
jgi:hypothetical protein